MKQIQNKVFEEEILQGLAHKEEEEDLILVLMDQVGGWCHSDLRIF